MAQGLAISFSRLISVVDFEFGNSSLPSPGLVPAKIAQEKVLSLSPKA